MLSGGHGGGLGQGAFGQVTAVGVCPFVVGLDQDRAGQPQQGAGLDVDEAGRASDSAGDSKSSKQNKGSKERQGTIWLKDGEFVRPLEVKAGTSDGANTAVTADNLQEGQEVVTGETSENSQATTKNPFLPQGNRH